MSYKELKITAAAESAAINPPPMRGIRQALAAVKSADPDTALTERALRRLVLTGEVPSVRVGTKYLLNLDALFEYLRGGSVPHTAAAVRPGIRIVKG